MTYLEERAKSMAEQPVYPPSQSYSGNNAYYEGACIPAGYIPSYATCLHKIRALERDGSLAFTACENAIRSGECMAVAMRRREEEAGRALYYWDRQRMLALNDRLFKDAIAASGMPTSSVAKRPDLKSAPRKVATSSPAQKPDENGFAAAINRAMQELGEADSSRTDEAAPIEQGTTSAPGTVLKPVAGLSLVQIAKLRMKAAKHQEETV